MTTPPPQKLTVTTLQALADVVGVHRRTLQEYRDQGCPCIKLGPKQYLVWPTLWWYTRRQMRDVVRRYVKNSITMPDNITETIEQLLVDHEHAWPLHIEQEAYR